MRIAMTGSTGLVGSVLSSQLAADGHDVTALVRRTPSAGQIQWDPNSPSWDASDLNGCDAVVHLAGENIAAGRWTAAMKQRIEDSRVKGTDSMSTALAKLDQPPATMICASAIGYYGNRGNDCLDETSAAGEGFLADVCQRWEQASRPAQAAGIRVVHARIGVVLSTEGGALAKMLTPFRLGLGGRVGSGDQFWSWVSVDDVAGATRHALNDASLAGPVNVVAPDAVTNRDFTGILAEVLHRPALFPMPAFAARLLLGEMAEELLLSSTRVTPRRLQESGYAFQHPTLKSALTALLRPAGT